MSFKRSKCNRCGGSIVWARFPTGKACPFDAEPTTQGHHILYQDLGAVDVTAVRERDVARELWPLYRDRYIPHLVTCPVES